MTKLHSQRLLHHDAAAVLGLGDGDAICSLPMGRLVEAVVFLLFLAVGPEGLELQAVSIPIAVMMTRPVAHAWATSAAWLA
jgi:hypothetical protein